MSERPMTEQNSEKRVDGVAGLKKSKIKVSGVVFMIYCLVAAGAFGIEEMVPLSGPGLTLVLLIVFPIIWAYPISEMIAELGSLLPSEGGVYIWCREALGEFWGWQVGFWNGASIWLQQALYCVLVAGYIGKYADLTTFTEYVIKIGMIVIFSLLNIMGLKEVSIASTIFSILVIIAFGVVTIVGFCNWNYNPFEPMINEDEGVIGSLGGSISIAVWMFCGYECMANMAEEVENPQIIPKGMIIAQPIIALSYLLPTLAGIASVGQWTKWATDGTGAVGYMDVLIQNIGNWAGIAFLIVAILSNCSIFNSYITSGSRCFFVMADDHLFPRFLCRVNQRRGTPVVAIVIMACFTIVMCKFDFTTLVMATTPLQLYIYMAVSVCVKKLRKEYPVEERKKQKLFVMPGGKPGLMIIVTLPFIISIIALYVNGTEYFIAGFVMLLISLLLYLICKWAFKGRVLEDADAYPLNPKTKLALGDTINIGIYVFLSGIAAFAGSILLFLYEGSWGPEYYKDTYDTGFFSDFYGMIHTLRWGGLALIAAGLIIWRIGKKTEGPALVEVEKLRKEKRDRLMAEKSNRGGMTEQ